MKRLQISIPKPCHQDWNKMTPDERGRFCSMCSKTVVDFSQKTEDEILSFINAHRNEGVCGRFRSDQLNQPSRIELPLHVYRSQPSFVNAFIIALLFCFGTTLFANAQSIEPAQELGKTKISSTEDSVKSITIPNEIMVIGDTILPEQFNPEREFFKLGEAGLIIDTAALLPIDTTPSQEWLGVTSEESIFTIGDIDEPMPTIEWIVGDIAWVPIATMGFVVTSIEDDCFPPVEVPDLVNTDPIPIITEEEIVNVETAINTEPDLFPMVFPNPSEGLVNIKFQPGDGQNVRVDLFDLNGQWIRNLMSGEFLQPELNLLQLDITGQPPGIYFLRINSGGKVKTEKIVLAGR